MKQYINLLQKILRDGEPRGDRTGIGTLSIFGGQLEFDLRERFPLVTIKKTLWKHAFTEMLWFLRGESNTSYLKQHDIKIWDDWADENGNLGPVYGVQWRKWPGKVKYMSMMSHPGEGCVNPWDIGAQKLESSFCVQQENIDQIKLLIEGIKANPTGRRHIVTAWNPAFIDEMGLPPCHRDFHCYVSNDGYLDLMMAIRSWDTALGGPFNIAQYALLTHLIARATDLKPRYLKINYGDAHIYQNHREPIYKMLQERDPVSCDPKLVFLTDNKDIDGYKPDDFSIVNYQYHAFLKLPIAV